LPLVRGVRMASVITTSSGFFCRLFEANCQHSVHENIPMEAGNMRRRRSSHILSSGFWPGVICESTFWRRCVAMLIV
jgi:hypothetical protein